MPFDGKNFDTNAIVALSQFGDGDLMEQPPFAKTRAVYIKTS